MHARLRCAQSALVFTALLLTGCAAGEPQAVDKPAVVQPTAVQQAAEPQATERSPEAKAYLDELLALMQEGSINRFTIDWADFRAKVYAKAPGAKTIEDTRPAISEALRLLNDRHSVYQPKYGSRISSAGCSTVPVSTAPVGVPVVPSTIGYISVSRFEGTAAEAAAFARGIQETIKVYDSQGVTGWLVDLRQNSGGNMWPMITGLSLILGDGPLGSFIDPLGAKTEWGLRDGGAYIADLVMDQNKATFRLQTEAPRVAVLTDAQTASSGEAVVIAFRGRADTRSFGTPTCGLSTANHSYPLSDGGFLHLTTSVMADREGRAYGGPVVPDEVIEDPAKVAERAIAWLQTGKAE